MPYKHFHRNIVIYWQLGSIILLWFYIMSSKNNLRTMKIKWWLVVKCVVTDWAIPGDGTWAATRMMAGGSRTGVSGNFVLGRQNDGPKILRCVGLLIGSGGTARRQAWREHCEWGEMEFSKARTSRGYRMSEAVVRMPDSLWSMRGALTEPGLLGRLGGPGLERSGRGLRQSVLLPDKNNFGF